MSITDDVASLLAGAREGGVPDTVLLVAVARAGAWQALAEAPDVLDRLDPHLVAVEVLVGRADWVSPPAEIVAVVAARHVLRALDPVHRRLARELAMVRYTGTAPASAPAGNDPVWWAKLDREVPHLQLAGHDGKVTRWPSCRALTGVRRCWSRGAACASMGAWPALTTTGPSGCGIPSPAPRVAWCCGSVPRCRR